MSEFQHTVENMIWIRGNELAPNQRRPIDAPNVPGPPSWMPANVRSMWPPNPRALLLSEANVELVYGDTVENFELDFGEKYEGLPPGIDERIYRQGRSHALNQIDRGTIDGGPMPWPFGDRAIAALAQLLKAQEDRQPIPPEPPPPPEPPMVLSRRQFFQIAAVKGMITQQEALDAVRTGTIPQLMQTALEGLSPDDKFAAEMMLSGATEFDRNHPLVEKFRDAMKMTPAMVDQMWREGMQL